MSEDRNEFTDVYVMILKIVLMLFARGMNEFNALFPTLNHYIFL